MASVLEPVLYGAVACRQGLGVNGGEPLGFDVGAKAAGGTLPGLDLVRAGLRLPIARKVTLAPHSRDRRQLR